MSIFPTTRISRALVAAAVVTGVTVIAPFLWRVFRLAGDELTELPPLTPVGTSTSFLLANPVAWFLAVAAAVYVLLGALELGARLSARSRPPARRPTNRRPTTNRRPAAQRTTTQRTTTQRTAARKPPSKAPAKAPAKRTSTARRGPAPHGRSSAGRR